MHPVIALELGGLEVQTAAYRLFLVLAAALTVGLGWAVAARRGPPLGRSLTCLLAMAVAVPVGARLWDVATKSDLYAADPGQLLKLDFAGLSLFGGLSMAMVAGVVACRLLAVDLVRLADSTAPALGVGIAVMRLGCFEAGCCFGKVTDLPWGVTFPAGSEAHLYQLLSGGLLFSPGGPLPVHPTQLYEAAAALVGTAVAGWLLARRAAGGSAFLAFVLWYALFRLVNHFLRVPGAALTVEPWFYPALYAAVASIAGAALLLRPYMPKWPRASWYTSGVISE